MKISTAHQKFSEKHLQKPDALENPQDYLGSNYLSVLNFWLWMDTLTTDQWKEVARRSRAIPYAARYAAECAARCAARDAAWDASRDAAWCAAWYAAGNAASWATVEIMGSHILIEKGTPLTFVPLFNDL